MAASESPEVEVSPELFKELGNLEKELAKVELDALRSTSFRAAPIYAKRAGILSQIPNFWPTALFNGPQEFQSILSHEIDPEDPSTNIDITTIGAIKSINVERYQIKGATEGEPRSIRFTFEFGHNDVFENEKVVKEFEYRTSADGEEGALVSEPVTFRWTKKGKKLMEEKSGGLLDLAVELYQAEEALKLKNKESGKDVEVVDREALWQYEKLREKLEKLDDEDDEGEGREGTWLDWFGYRGRVDLSRPKATEKANGHKESDTAEDEDEEEDEEPGMLDVEIFPAGEDIAQALADDLWPNVMDYFMAAQEPDLDDFDGPEDDDDEDLQDVDDDAPELVGAEQAPEERPAKKQRTT